MNTISTEEIANEKLLSIAKSIGPTLDLNVAQEENDRQLSDSTFSTLKDAGLYQMYLPSSLGGLETDPVTAATVVEEIASHNLAAGWSLMVANTPTWWCSRLPDEGIEEIFENGSETFLAGAFHPPMKAIEVDGGYRITGRSPLTSNVHRADWIFITALVMKGNEVKMNNGVPEVIGAHLKAGGYRIIDTWHTVGMRATDSNDVDANDVFVAKHLTYPVVPEFERNSYCKGKLYRYPAIGASITSMIAPVPLAIARNSINELKDLAQKKVPLGSTVSIREKGVVQRKLGMAEALMQSSRAYVHSTLSSAWKKTLVDEPLSTEDKAGMLLAAAHANQTCLQATDLMYSAAGTSGIYVKNSLSRYIADAQVLRQHGFANESRYETAAQVYLGLMPDLPVILF